MAVTLRNPALHDLVNRFNSCIGLQCKNSMQEILSGTIGTSLPMLRHQRLYDDCQLETGAIGLETMSDYLHELSTKFSHVALNIESTKFSFLPNHILCSTSFTSTCRTAKGFFRVSQGTQEIKIRNVSGKHVISNVSIVENLSMFYTL